MSFKGVLEVSLKSELLGSLTIERLKSSIDRVWRLVFDDGTGAGQANKEYSATRTLASNTSESLDLYGGLTDAFGATINLAKIKMILIVADPTNTTNLTVGNVANGVVAPFGAATHSVQVQPGGMFLVATPAAGAFGVTDATADLLKIANAAGGAANYDIVVIGVG